MKNVLITGTSRGLGANLLNNFFEKGFDVVSLGRSKPKISIPHLDCDFHDIENLESTLNSSNLLQNHFDIIILNSGTLGKIKSANKVSRNELLSTFNVNFFSNKIIIDSCLSNSNGLQKYIFISSGASQKGYTGWLEYCTSKSAFDSLMRVYAKENLSKIFVSISPGAIDTAMQEIIRNTDTKLFPDMQKFYELKKLSNLRSPKEGI